MVELTKMGVTVLILHRRDPTVNMARFYALSLENSLFGDILLVRRWGRIGTHGRVRFDWFDNPADAANELTRIASAKARRGYQNMAQRPSWMGATALVRPVAATKGATIGAGGRTKQNL
jgi:predicted DNA-binding WGR domain protein